MIEIVRYSSGNSAKEKDWVAAEEPLEIRVVFGGPGQRRGKGLSITMRTPGQDPELAIGFLLSEGIVSAHSDIASTSHVGPAPENGVHGNTIRVELSPDVEFEVERLQRHFYTTSSCGICGKASLESVRAQGIAYLDSNWAIDCDLVCQLPKRLRDQQAVFDQTGGLHAAGIFDRTGNLLSLFEDVGRHNAVDKLFGDALLKRAVPLSERVLVVSGRASFELVQKALMAGVPLMIAVGAPSSLAVELAREFGLTLVGFASANRFNVYSHESRINGLNVV